MLTVVVFNKKIQETGRKIAYDLITGSSGRCYTYTRCVQLYKNRMRNDCPENSFEYMEAGDLSEHRLHLNKQYAATAKK